MRGAPRIDSDDAHERDDDDVHADHDRDDGDRDDGDRDDDDSAHART